MKPIGNKSNIFTSEECRAVRAILEDSERNAEFGREVPADFEQCRSCRLYAQQLSGLRNLVASQPRVAAPPDFDIKLRRRINESVNGAPVFGRLFLRPITAVATAAVVAGFAAVMTFFVQKPGHMEKPARSIASVSVEYPAGSSETASKSMVTGVEPSDGAKDSASVKASPSLTIASSRRVSGEPVREMRLSNFKRNGSRDGSEDIMVVIQDRSNRTHTVPIKMVTYGSQPVVNLGTL